MRINVYAEELTTDSTVVTKQVDGRTFYGIRMFLKSAPELHHTESDDDRSAITFWVRWFNGINHHDAMINVLYHLYKQALRARNEEAEQKASQG